ncbi:MAG: hypothetical protein AAFZ15_28075 [Bacteroidota bacterium]
MIQSEKIDWAKAIDRLESGGTHKESASLNHHLANCYSLSALFLADYSVALNNIKKAKALEPFNPIHQYRLVLLFFHFGQWEQGRLLLEQMQEKLPESVSLKYLRSMSALRVRGLEKRAGIIAKDISRQNKDFQWAAFLSVESAVRVKFKKGILEKGFRSLPKGPEYQASWLDLFVKIIILYGNEGIKFVQGTVKTFKPFEKEKPNKAEELLNRLIAWSAASEQAFNEDFAGIVPNTKLEQMALICHFNRNKRKEDFSKYLSQVRRLHLAFPERNAVKRLYAANLSLIAVEKASKGDLNGAMAILEVCQKLEPHNLINWQNKATIFTLLRERKSYYEAWETLDRYHFRLALLGRFNQHKARFLAKRFRMFAQQAKMTSSTEENGFQLNFGIFKKETRINNNVLRNFIAVNQQVIDNDPEQLRQWLHFTAVELVFLHLSLGTKPANYLLGCPDELAGKAKLDALTQLASALQVLIKEEGALLKEKVTEMWQNQWKMIGTAQADPDQSEAAFVKSTHLETIADAALLLYSWEPSADHEYMVNELIDFFKAECLFLDAKLLFEDEKDNTPYQVSLLKQVVIEILDLDKPKESFSLKELTKISDHLCSDLLIGFSIGTYEQLKSNAKSAARKAVQILEKAQKLNNNNPRIEYFRARYLFIGGFFEESKKAIAKFYKITQDDEENPLVKSIEDIQKALEEVDGKGQSYAPVQSGQVDFAREEKEEMVFGELLKEIDQFPTSTQTYEQIIYLLIRKGEYEAASDWAKKAIARCLSRQGQLKSRLLSMETEAFFSIKSECQEEINFYTKGIHSGLHKVLEKLTRTDNQSYLIEFLLGQCFLKSRNPRQASNHFRAALENCSKQLYYGVLKVLASDIDKVMLASTQKTVAEAIQAKDFEQAFGVITEFIAQIKQPEKGLMLLVDTLLKAITHHLDDPAKIPPVPVRNIQTDWNPEWLAVLKREKPIDAVKGILNLSLKYNASDEERNRKIQSQIKEIENQQALAATIANISDLSEKGDFEKALLELDKLKGHQTSDALIDRQKITLLLKLNRFEEAESLLENLQENNGAAYQSFLNNYETLKFQQVAKYVQGLLRKGDHETALPLLNSVKPKTPAQKLDLAYFKAFGLTVKAYQKKGNDQRAEKINLLIEAIDEIEPFIGKAKVQDLNHVQTLYDKLTKDLHDLKSNDYGK